MASAILFYIVIIPNAFATELIKMIAAKNGQRYLIIKQKIFLRRNGCPSFVISFSNLSTPTTLDTRRHVAIAAIGIITEFVMKSKKSRNCIPRILKSASGPYTQQHALLPFVLEQRRPYDIREHDKPLQGGGSLCSGKEDGGWRRVLLYPAGH